MTTATAPAPARAKDDEAKTDRPGPARIPLRARHQYSLREPFTKGWQGYALLALALLPIWWFPIAVWLWLSGWWTYFLLQLNVVVVPLFPPVFWWFAARRVVSPVIVLRRAGKLVIAVCIEWWPKKDVLDLPAEAPWGNGRPDRAIPVIDGLDPVIEGEGSAALTYGLEFDPARRPIPIITSEAVARAIETSGSTYLNSAKSRGFTAETFKTGGLLILIFGLAFVIYLVAAKMLEPAAGG